MKKKVLFFLLVLITTLWSCTKERAKKVFVVFSYHPEFSWVISENGGIDEVFEGKKLEVERFYMDTKRKTGLEWMKQVSDSAIARIETFKPDVLMVFDDNACEWVAKHYVNTDLPVVFAGMNNEPSDYGFPAENVTGVIERIPFYDIISFLKTLVPEVQSVAFISDDSPTSEGIEDNLKELELPVDVAEIVATNDFREWKAKIVEWQDKVDAIGVLTFNTITDTLTGESLKPEKVIDWIVENNKIPDFASFEFGVEYGLLCGATSPASAQSIVAAEMALKILGGVKPADLEIVNPENVIKLLNTKRAEQLGIYIPEGVEYEKVE